MNKRGISAVVATVLIILITVAAITIIWTAIIPMINNNLKSSNQCMLAQGDLRIGPNGYTCINGSNITVEIARQAADYDLAGIQVIIYKGGTSTSYTINDTASDPLPGKNLAKVYSMNNTSYTGADRIVIAPIVRAGNVKQTCGEAQSTPLMNCSA
jgi:hypothetical protein